MSEASARAVKLQDNCGSHRDSTCVLACRNSAKTARHAVVCSFPWGDLQNVPGLHTIN